KALFLETCLRQLAQRVTPQHSSSITGVVGEVKSFISLSKRKTGELFSRPVQVECLYVSRLCSFRSINACHGDMISRPLCRRIAGKGGEFKHTLTYTRCSVKMDFLGNI